MILGDEGSAPDRMATARARVAHGRLRAALGRVHAALQRRAAGRPQRRHLQQRRCSRPASRASRAALVHRRDRVAWIAMGAAVLAWGVGNTVWTFTVANLADPPFPSFADIGFLAVYPPAYVADRAAAPLARAGSLRSSLWLDGVISGLAVGAVGTRRHLPGDPRTRSAAARAPPSTTNLAYPLARPDADRAWSSGRSRVTGWRPGRTWGLVAAGLLVFSISDCLYLYETAVGTYTNGSPTDLGWVAGCVLLAWAAWQPRRVAEPRPGARGLAAARRAGRLRPRSASPCCLYDHFASRAPARAHACEPLDPRRDRADGDHLRARTCACSRARGTRPHTDVLTGPRQPPAAAARPRAARSSPGTGRSLLALFDLNGFKQYNDAFGHPAGDALLGRLGAQPRRASSPGAASAYRMGGDEFCIARSRAATARRASSSPAPSVRCASTATASTSRRVVRRGHAARRRVDGASEALGLADQRMYAQKKSRRVSPPRSARPTSCSRAISEGDPTSSSEHSRASSS